MNVLEINNLSKSFGTHKVIDDISFAVPENCIYGLIGANGAGKTTTMKMILGLLKTDGGEIEICGERVSYGETKTNRMIGYLPDVPEYYSYMRPKEYLKLCADIVGLDKGKANVRIEELLGLVGLEGVKKKIGSFSRGMKQRLGVAQALIGDPRLLICDEPTSALDPIGRKEILDILQEIKGKTTVLFSTHILSDVEKICDKIGVLNNGKIVLESSMEDLKLQKKAKSLTLEFENEVDAEDIMRLLADNNLSPLKYEIAEQSLESLFMEAVK